MAAIVEHLVTEPRVEQMQHGMFRPADIQVNRHPGILHFLIYKGLAVLRIEEAEIIPAGAGPLRHGVCLCLL